jgi:hypothetical protein
MFWNCIPLLTFRASAQKVLAGLVVKITASSDKALNNYFQFGKLGYKAMHLSSSRVASKLGYFSSCKCCDIGILNTDSRSSASACCALAKSVPSGAITL